MGVMLKVVVECGKESSQRKARRSETGSGENEPSNGKQKIDNLLRVSFAADV